MTATPGMEPAISVDSNATPRERRASAVATSQLVMALDSIPECIAVWDTDDSLVACNIEFERLLRRGAGPLIDGEVLGRSRDELRAAVAKLCPPDQTDAEAAFPNAGDAATGHDLTLSDGRTLHARTYSMPHGGQVTVLQDISEKLRHLRECKRQRREAERLNRVKNDFIASMSHELRTPLNAVLGFAQLLRRAAPEEMTELHRDWVGQIFQAGSHLMRLIDEVLDLARIEANELTVAQEPFGIGECVSQVVESLGPSALAGDIELRVTHTCSPLPNVEADSGRLTQILLNFGSNAIKYNRRGGHVTFSVSTPNRERVRIAVIDTGMGIPEHRQDELFQPFRRAGQEGSAIQGTGMGLAISRRLAHLMKGSVGFSSTPGRGSEFWVEIPSSKVASTPPPRPPLQVSASPGTRDALVLYVEDNPASIAFMESLLGSLNGVRVLSAMSAEVGLALAREHRPDLVIMDLNLPGMSGFEAVQALRDSAATRETPVVALTACAMQPERQRAETAGFYCYLTKPLQIEELEKVLLELLP